MTLQATWTTEEYVDEEALVRALEQTVEALSLACSIWIEPPDEDHEYEERPASAVIVLTADADTETHVELDVAGPVPIRGTLLFTGYDIELWKAASETDWERAYLFAEHLAMLLGMAHKTDFDEESDYVDEVQTHVDAAMGSLLERLERDDEIVTVEAEALPGAVGPLWFDVAQDADGLVITARGAGTDVRCRVSGLSSPLDEEARRQLVAELEDDPPLADADQERAIRLATTPPSPSVQSAGKLVAFRWVDGVAGEPREIALDEPLGALVDDGGFCDLVRYFSDGQPALRCIPMWVMADRKPSSVLDEPSWAWKPASTAEIVDLFERVTRSARASFVAPPEPALGPLTLGSWLESFARISGRLRGLSAGQLLRADAQDGGGLPDGWRASSRIDMQDVAQILFRIESLAQTGSLEEHAGFLASGEWANDSTDLFVEELVALLELPEPPRPSEPAPYDAYLATMNEAASLLGHEERLYVVPNRIGLTLVIKLLPATFEALTAAGLLEAHAPVGPGPAHGGMWAQLRGWWAKRSS